MLHLRRAVDRGHEDKGWLQTHHTFSFDSYYDPEHLGFKSLRVINEDVVSGGKGFSAHFHKDMEIVTYVISGTLEHQDSLGNTGVIRSGEVQLMSAGTGIMHSERNFHSEIPAHFLQIWIRPNQNSLEPTYTQRQFSSASKWGQWRLLVSNNGREGSIRIHQDADIYATLLEEDDQIDFQTLLERFYWVQIVSGKFMIQNTLLEAGDGGAICNELNIDVRCLEGGELLLFDLV